MAQRFSSGRFSDTSALMSGPTASATAVISHDVRGVGAKSVTDNASPATYASNVFHHSKRRSYKTTGHVSPDEVLLTLQCAFANSKWPKFTLHSTANVHSNSSKQVFLVCPAHDCSTRRSQESTLGKLFTSLLCRHRRSSCIRPR